MSSGERGDWSATKRQLSNPNPCKDGRTWLRHKEDGQSGQIDLMVLEGQYSLEDMVNLLRKGGLFKSNLKHDHCLKRVRDHLDHLCNGCSRSLANGQEPHRLKLKESNGKWAFDLDDSSKTQPLPSSPEEQPNKKAEKKPIVAGKKLESSSNLGKKLRKYVIRRPQKDVISVEKKEIDIKPVLSTITNEYKYFINRILNEKRTKWWENLDGEVRQGRSGSRYLEETLEAELSDVPTYRKSERRLFFFTPGFDSGK